MEDCALWNAINNYRPVLKEMLNHEHRQKFVREYAWAFPTPGAIAEIAEFATGDTILEVGAGLGLWARLLQSRGVDVIPTDINPGMPWPPGDDYFGTYTLMHKIGARAAVRKYKQADILMICWPPYNRNLANRALTAFTGSRVIFIGERAGGCTGDDAFFRNLNHTYTQRYVEIPQWFGMHDGLYLCTRIKPAS